jgi:trimeric autotransporter adhesin
MFFNISGDSNTAIGLGALENNSSGNFNTAIGTGALANNTKGTGNTASGLEALYFNTTGNGNTANGITALEENSTGSNNTVSGYEALQYNTTGSNNTASGYEVLAFNTTGGNNTATGFGALYYNATGSNNTALGYGASPDNKSTNLNYATAIGAGAVVSQSNTLVLGGPLGSAGQVKVGIGTAAPANVFTIAQGAGPAVSDGWNVYSSRRWKTNIETLHGALSKIEQLRGVSYELKANGKHEMGVIAEEVGAVVPEVVTWDQNGKDAQSVDYSRLTALLIEATKEQQALIEQQQRADRPTNLAGEDHPDLAQDRAVKRARRFAP